MMILTFHLRIVVLFFKTLCYISNSEQALSCKYLLFSLHHPMIFILQVISIFYVFRICKSQFCPECIKHQYLLMTFRVITNILIFSCLISRQKVSKYERGNQRLHIGGQIIQWPNVSSYKNTDNSPQNTKQKTKE